MAHHQPIRKQAGTGPAKPPAEIPDKLYFRIGEVSRLCEVPAYVLRFWEGEFPQLKPNKGGTGQRLFRRRDVEMALRIKCLLYDEGYTIPGARQLLKTETKAKEPQLSLLPEDPGRAKSRDRELQSIRQDLQDLLLLLARAPSAIPVKLGQSAARSTAPPGSRRVSLLAVPVLAGPVNDRLFDFADSTTAQAASDSTSPADTPGTTHPSALTDGPEIAIEPSNE